MYDKLGPQSIYLVIPLRWLISSWSWISVINLKIDGDILIKFAADLSPFFQNVTIVKKVVKTAIMCIQAVQKLIRKGSRCSIPLHNLIKFPVKKSISVWNNCCCYIAGIISWQNLIPTSENPVET